MRGRESEIRNDHPNRSLQAARGDPSFRNGCFCGFPGWRWGLVGDAWDSWKAGVNFEGNCFPYQAFTSTLILILRGKLDRKLSGGI